LPRIPSYEYLVCRGTSQIGHQAELFKIAEHYPVEFYLLENNVRRWKRTQHRKLPDHVKFVQYYEPGKYDLAILHLDQQCVNPDIGKGHLYRDLNSVITDIPKIVINHGTPDYQEMYEEDLVINGGFVLTKEGDEWVDGMKQLIGDNFMIVNSYTAAERWGWGYPIIHGLDPEEWPVLDKEFRVSLPLSPGGLDHYYNRPLISDIKQRVHELSGYEVTHMNVNYEPEDGQDYKNFLSRSLIQIFPFRDSPMPRSRTEAMLMGSCVLSSKNHGADEFIENGVNGFILPDNPLKWAETINQLLNYHYQDCIEVGKKGRETALKLFNGERYRKDIWNVIQQVANGEKPEWDGKKIWD
jgi:hypothetical protein